MGRKLKKFPRVFFHLGKLITRASQIGKISRFLSWGFLSVILLGWIGFICVMIIGGTQLNYLRLIQQFLFVLALVGIFYYFLIPIIARRRRKKTEGLGPGTHSNR